MVGELAARQVADVQLNACGSFLRVWRIGHGVGTAGSVTQDELHVLPGVIAEGVCRRQLQADAHHVV